ncbi:hypothetical protein L2E82_03605 [Cichorium intybus]|uniref:Uncharacterized protein n=1 Tax=Cichorium intybus TaxID=13427 RepID=A0ACB9H6B8_CICIN|nr:hypothetical protein L2E82_03605 [Cichorium intybus]
MAAFSSATETPSFPYRTSTKLMPSFSQSSNHNISPSFSVFKPLQIYAIWRYQVEAVSLGLMEGVESKDWLKGLMEGLESKDWLKVYDSLNDVRRMTLYH